MFRSSVVRIVAVAAASCVMAILSLGQTPNTGAIVVSVVDQNDAAVPGVSVSIVNSATGATREIVSGDEGSATIAGLPIGGKYAVKVSKSGFSANDVTGLTLRAGETSQVKIKLAVTGGSNQVTVFGTTEGVRNDPQIGRLIESREMDETPILSRKFSSIPLLNSAFRQGKGTGDLFVNQTYFITGVGSRRATTFTIDGASNDEGWGRQVGVATIPMGAVQEVNVMSNAFSSEFGWTSGPALNIVTKSGSNAFHGEILGLLRPGGSFQAKRFSLDGFCPESVASSCTVPTALQRILPIDIPDKLGQIAGSIGGPIIHDKTFFFVSAERTMQNRTTFISPTLGAAQIPGGSLEYAGRYRQTIFDGRLDHKLASNQDLMWRFNFDQFYDDNPQDAVSGTNAPSVARKYSRRSWTTQLNHTAILSPALLNEFRFAFLNGDPVTKWEAATVSTIYTRGAGNGALPFTLGQSRQSDLFSRQFQFADTLSWTAGKHYLRFGTSIIRHRSGGTGNEPGALTLGTFTFKTTAGDPRTQLPFDQLTLGDVLNYSQPINFGITSYDLSQWLLTGFVQDKWRVRPDLTLDIGLRYDRQTLTDAKSNFQPRLGFAWNPGGNARTVIRSGYGMYYTQIRTNSVAGYLINGLDGISSYTATPGQAGFPTCLTCAPVNVDPLTLPAAVLPARDITIVAGKREFYVAQFARYGLDFNRIAPNYSDRLVNPRSQVFTIGVEHEFFKGLFVGSDYVRQHLSNIDRSVDLNAPTPFSRTAPGQTRTAAAANLTRPILPVNGGVRQINTIMNLGVADYDGWQNQISYRGNRKFQASVSYTLSKATNTTEPDGNGMGPNETYISELNEQERGPSVVDQRHRAVIQVSYNFPWSFTAGTLMQFASARPFNSTTGVDNNGDGIQNDRPVIDGVVVPKSSFRGRATQDVAVYIQNRIRFGERASLTLRVEGFNIFNYANMLGRGVTVYGNTAVANPDFGRFVPVTNADVAALPAFANIDPPRMFQLQARFSF
ncbi:MAG TPA: TonB-dependent receptor [Pyrinomonadaceae bacterium]|nr:TonB-dependent receptor [Pyrinomonadaceae bacterium]